MTEASLTADDAKHARVTAGIETPRFPQKFQPTQNPGKLRPPVNLGSRHDRPARLAANASFQDTPTPFRRSFQLAGPSAQFPPLAHKCGGYATATVNLRLADVRRARRLQCAQPIRPVVAADHSAADRLRPRGSLRAARFNARRSRSRRPAPQHCLGAGHEPRLGLGSNRRRRGRLLQSRARRSRPTGRRRA